MPIYEYRCQDCEQLFEEWQKDFSERELACPVCGGASRRLISNTSFVLKGSGWYVTDYCRSKNGVNGGNGGNGSNGSTKTNGSGKSEGVAAPAVDSSSSKADSCAAKSTATAPPASSS